MSLDLFLGKAPSGAPVVLRDPENPHVSISGRSGCGKSYFLKNLIHQAVRQGACCIVFDYTGDFTLDVYGHVTDQMKQASAARMDTFIKDVLKLP